MKKPATGYKFKVWVFAMVPVAFFEIAKKMWTRGLGQFIFDVSFLV